MDPRQLPGARVRAPCVEPRGTPGRHAAQCRAARQGDLARALRRQGAARPELPRLCLRCLGAHGVSRRLARLLQWQQRVHARARARGRDAARLDRRPAARLAGGDGDAGRARRGGLRGRGRRRAGRSSVRARHVLARQLRGRGRAARVRRRRRLAELRRRTAARRCEASVRDADRLLARRGQAAVRALRVHAQRRRGRLRRARAPREHGADRGAARTARRATAT